MKSSYVSVVVATLISLSTVGCFKKPIKIAKVEFKVQATPKINPDPVGNPLSVVVRVYQLKNTVEFAKLGLDRLSSDRPDAELFGQDLVGKVEMVAVPGGSLMQIDQIHPDAQYLAIVGFFREPDPNFWRVVVAAKDVRKALGLKLKVQECFLEIEGVPLVPLPGVPLGAEPRCGSAKPKNP